MRILSYRFNSEAELRRKLQRKQFGKEEIEAVVQKLRDEKWLDDERFAGVFVRTRSAKKIGKLRIVRELQAAGVDREEAALAIDRNIDPEVEREQLAALCAKRLRVLIRRHGEEYAASADGRNKLAAWLLKHGYDAALVQSVMKETRVAHHQ